MKYRTDGVRHEIIMGGLKETRMLLKTPADSCFSFMQLAWTGYTTQVLSGYQHDGPATERSNLVYPPDIPQMPF